MKTPAPGAGGRGFHLAFVTLDRAAKGRRGQQGGNPPQAALSYANVGVFGCLPSERGQKTAAAHPVIRTTCGDTLFLIDEMIHVDHCTGRRCPELRRRTGDLRAES